MSASIQVLTRAIQPLEILPRKDAPMCLAEIAEALCRKSRSGFFTAHNKNLAMPIKVVWQ